MDDIKTTVTEQLQRLQSLMQRASFSVAAGELKINNPHRGQGRVLSMLKIKPEISQKELGFLLDMSKQSLAELLTKLEKSGYITREPSETDRRAVTVKLTESGREAAEEVDENRAESMQVLDCLDEQELTVLSGYLDRLIKQYEDQLKDAGKAQYVTLRQVTDGESGNVCAVLQGVDADAVKTFAAGSASAATAYVRRVGFGATETADLHIIRAVRQPEDDGGANG